MKAPQKLTTQQQRRHLKDRIDSISSNAARARHNIHNAETEKEPAVIRQARERIATFKKQREEKIESEVKRKGLDHETVLKCVREAREKLLFASADEALAAVRKLEDLYPYADK